MFLTMAMLFLTSALSQDPAPEQFDPELEVNELIAAVRSGARPLQLSALSDLGEIGAGAKNSVPVLLDVLETNDSSFQRNVVSTLGDIGPFARAASASLARLLKAEQSELRSAVLTALAKIGGSVSTDQGSIIAFLSDPAIEVQVSAIHALGCLYPRNIVVVEKVLECLKSNNSRVRASAASSLLLLDEKSERVRTALRMSVSDNDLDVKFQSAYCLLRLFGSNEVTLQALISVAGGSPDTVSDSEELRDIRLSAIEALEESAEQCGVFEAKLESLLQEKDGVIRCAIARILWRLGKDRDKLVQLVSREIISTDVDTRSEAIDSIIAFDIAPTAIKSVRELLKDKAPRVRCKAVAYLYKSDELRREAVDAVTELLRNSKTSYFVILQALRVVSKIKPIDVKLRDALMALCHHKRARVRFDAKAILSSKGP